MKTNYPELIGKRVTLVDYDGVVTECTIAGLNYKDGITLVSCEDTNYFDKDEEAYCINRKEQLKWKGYTKAQYRKEFHDLVEMIKKGRISEKACAKRGHWLGAYGAGESAFYGFGAGQGCAFK
jgi:hypothetical protein